MKRHTWNADKSDELKRERGITFEMIVQAMVDGGLLDTIVHPKQDRYPGQLLYIVEVEGYVYVVPFVPGDDENFLKTIYPSRKLTRHYLGRNDA